MPTLSPPGPQSLARARLAQCLTCPNVKNTIFGARCTLCGCFVRLKTLLASQSCPIGIWGAQ